MKKILGFIVASFLILGCSSDKDTASDSAATKADAERTAGLVLVDAYIPYRSDEQQHFAAYFELQNNTDKAVKVVDAYSPAFGMVMLHETVFEDGMAKMKHIDAIDLAANESVLFKPKGKHVMLMQPQRDLSSMEGVYLVLELADGSKEKYGIDFRKK